MKTLLPRLVASVFVLLFGAAMACGGWWFGFRDGLGYANAEVGGRLAVIHMKDRSTQGPEATQQILDLLTTNVVCHLLTIDHTFPMFAAGPRNKAQGALMQLRASWNPDEKLFRKAESTVTRFDPFEPEVRDHFAAWQAVQPRWIYGRPPKPEGQQVP